MPSTITSHRWPTRLSLGLLALVATAQACERGAGSRELDLVAVDANSDDTAPEVSDALPDEAEADSAPGDAPDTGDSSDEEIAVEPCGDGVVAPPDEVCDPADTLAHAVCRDDCSALLCDDGFADCNGNPADGCEVELATSARHCGACERDCGSVSCRDGVCQVRERCPDGRWHDDACGNSVCGVLPDGCETPTGGCDCGPNDRFEAGIGCVYDAACGAVAHACVTDPAALSEPLTLGRRCAVHADCSDIDGGRCFNGMCTRDCESDAECAPGTRCIGDYCDSTTPHASCPTFATEGMRLCLPDGCCLYDSHCPQGWACIATYYRGFNGCCSTVSVTGGGFCAPRCDEGQVCPDTHPVCRLGPFDRTDDVPDSFEVCLPD